MTKETLTMKELLPKVRKYVKNGKLGAQKHDRCSYEYADGSRCVIGCGLEDTHMGGTLKNLVDIGTIYISSREEEKEMVHLQALHDTWAVRNSEKTAATKDARKQFYKYLHKMYKKYEV